jgi:glutamine amidotransferase-like uncharacterized protein
MKRFIFALIPVLMLCAGCATAPQCSPAAEKCAVQYTGKKIKTGFYIDKGSRGGGVLNLAKLLYYSPQIELTLLKGEDLRNGKLEGLDMIVMPGGSSQLQMESMGKEGVKALQDFVRKGGAYVGICAGFHITLNRPERAQLMPYTYIREAVGYRADVQIDLSPEGAKLLDIKPGKRMVRYSRGPVAREAKWDKGNCKTYAKYTSSVGPLGRAGVSFFDTPALIYGNYGKGKVIASSFHPEYLTATYEIFVGMVYAATGVKITPVFPTASYRPLRVLYYIGGALKGHAQSIKEVTALEKCPELAVKTGFDQDLLNETDLLIMPNGPESWGKGLIKNGWVKRLVDFMDRGGKIVAAGKAWNTIPDHKNMIRIAADACLVKAAVKVAAE